MVQNKVDIFKSHISHEGGKYNEYIWRYLQSVIPLEDVVKMDVEMAVDVEIMKREPFSDK